jgi:hypothetical protein
VIAFEKLAGNQLRATIHRALTLEERLALAMTHSGGSSAGFSLEPKKSLSAFMVFSAERRPQLREEDPELYNDLTTTQKKLGEFWRAMSDEDKEPYDAKAKADRARYLKEITQARTPTGGEGGGAAGGETDEEEREDAEAFESAKAAAAATPATAARHGAKR